MTGARELGPPMAVARVEEAQRAGRAARSTHGLLE